MARRNNITLLLGKELDPLDGLLLGVTLGSAEGTTLGSTDGILEGEVLGRKDYYSVSSLTQHSAVQKAQRWNLLRVSYLDS